MDIAVITHPIQPPAKIAIASRAVAANLEADFSSLSFSLFILSPNFFTFYLEFAISQARMGGDLSFFMRPDWNFVMEDGSVLCLREFAQPAHLAQGGRTNTGEIPLVGMPCWVALFSD